MRKHWIGIIKWNDGTILKTEPFYDYDEGIKVWSSKFSYENKGKFEWIDYKKIEPKQETLEQAAEKYSENWEEITGLDYDKFGDQRIPASFEDLTCWGWDCKDNIIELPKGSIKKLIGRDLKYEDNPVELIVDNPCELY